MTTIEKIISFLNDKRNLDEHCSVCVQQVFTMKNRLYIVFDFLSDDAQAFIYLSNLIKFINKNICMVDVIKVVAEEIFVDDMFKLSFNIELEYIGF